MTPRESVFDSPGTVGKRPGVGDLMRTIERVLPDGGDWCDLHKAHTLAALVLALRPRVIVEIGVWMGGSLVPMALALQWLDAHAAPALERLEQRGKIYGIDPWSPVASVAGEDDATNVAWWSGVDHETAYTKLLLRIADLGLAPYVGIARITSDDFEPSILGAMPGVVGCGIDLIHIDGNHTEQAHRDAKRYLPHVRVGGIVVFDDVGWGGGGVARGVEWAREHGFVDLYALGTGLVMQRVADALHDFEEALT